MTKDLASLIAVSMAISALGYWAFADEPVSFVYTVGEAVLAYVAIVGGLAIVYEIFKKKSPAS